MGLKRAILVLSFFMVVYSVIANNSKQSVLSSCELIEKIKKATDPHSKLGKIDTNLTEGEVFIAAQSIRANIKTFFKKPCKFMVETHFENGTIEKGGYDGKTVWKKSFNSEKSIEVKGMDRKFFILSSYLESPDILVWYEVFSSIRLDAEMQKIGGALCYKLICTPKPSFGINSPLIFFVDSKNFLIKRMDISSYNNGVEIRQNVLVNENKDFDGVMVPSKSKTNVMGTEIDYNITGFELNKKIDDNLFTMQD